MLVLYPRTKVSCVSQEHFPTYKQSGKNYTSVCLTFSPAITTFSGSTARQFCNGIQQYEGQATMPYTNTTKEEEDSTETQTTPTAGGFNRDF